LSDESVTHTAQEVKIRLITFYRIVTS